MPRARPAEADLRGLLEIGALPERLPQPLALLEACAAGLVQARRHGSLALLSYVPRATQGGTLSRAAAARGLVLDLSGRHHPVAAWPFPAFAELEPDDPLPAGTPDVTRKIDGALAILYWNGDRPGWAGRTRFTSPPARIAREIWHSNDRRRVAPELTLLCEVRDPALTPIVPARRRELILVGAIDRYVGRDLDYEALREVAAEARLPIVERVPWSGSLDDLWRQVRTDGLSSEGFVLRWSDGRRARLVNPEYAAVYDLLACPSPWIVSELWLERTRLRPLLRLVPRPVACEVARMVSELEDLEQVATRSAQVRDPRRAAVLVFRSRFRDPWRARLRSLPPDV